MSALPPARVEQALQLLPDLEAVDALRTALLSLARVDDDMRWGSAAPYLTVGKRGVDPAALRRRLPRLLQRVTDHIAALYDAYVAALEAQQRGDAGGAVDALLAAAGREEAVGRLAQARAWCEAALPLAAALQTRRPETECLLRLGTLGLALGYYQDGARHFQRALALAEAEFDQASATTASQGLGDIALARGEWPGAQAWYQRGLRLAEASGDEARIARLERRLGVLAHRRGNLAAARDQLRRARERLEALEHPAELAQALTALGDVDAARGDPVAAAAAYREALAWSRSVPAEPEFEVATRIALAQLALDEGRLLAAEEELRRAEAIAIDRHLVGSLIRVYGLMGRLRGMQEDEMGFVFFEQAVGLCRMLGRPAAERAWIYHQYGLFRHRLGQAEEARAYLGEALELFEALGKSVELDRVRQELLRLSA